MDTGEWARRLGDEGLARLTVVGYLTGVRCWVRWSGGVDPAAADPGQVRGWLGWLRREGYAGQTARCYARGVRRWVRDHGGEGRVAEVFAGVVMPRAVLGLRELLGGGEVAALLGVADVPWPWAFEAVRCMVALGSGCGLRAAEIVGVREVDVDLVGMRVYVRAGKGGWRGYLPLPGGHLGLHRDWLRRREGLVGAGCSAYLVHLDGRGWGAEAGHRGMRLALRAVGLERPGLTIHALRHAAISSWAETGNLRDAQELARHRSIVTTACYVHPTDGRLRSVVDRAAELLTSGEGG